MIQTFVPFHYTQELLLGEGERPFNQITHNNYEKSILIQLPESPRFRRVSLFPTVTLYTKSLSSMCRSGYR